MEQEGTRVSKAPSGCTPHVLSSVAWLPIRKNPGKTPLSKLQQQPPYIPMFLCFSSRQSSAPSHAVTFGLSHVLSVVSDSLPEVTGCLLPFRALPSAQPHHPRFLDLHQVVCDSCPPCKFIRNSLQKKTT